MASTAVLSIGHVDLMTGSRRRMTVSGFVAAGIIVAATSLVLLGIELQRQFAPIRSPRVVEVSELFRAHMMAPPAPAAKPMVAPPLPKVVKAVVPAKKFAAIVPVPDPVAAPQQSAPSQATAPAPAST